MNKSWHASEINEVFQKLNSSPSGLTQEEAKLRIKKYGENALESIKIPGVFFIVWKFFKNPLIGILILAGILSLFLKEFLDATGIFIAALMAIIIGVYQEEKASGDFKKLRQSLKRHIIVRRNNQKIQISSEKAVPGDILILERGNFVAADSRIVKSKNLRVNESILTGEWLAREKQTGQIAPETIVPEQTNMVFAGTFVEDGWGEAVVVKTGKDTEVGQIAESLKEQQKTPSPFQRDIKHLAKILTYIIVAVLIFIGVLGLIRGEPANKLILFAIAIAVAAIPEGLPAAISVILTVGARRIFKEGGLVKNLNTVETLGRTTIILSDKTGTLTKGEMSIAQIITADNVSNQINAKDKITEDSFLALKMACMASQAFIENISRPDEEWIIRGTPTEKAILQGLIALGHNPEQLKSSEEELDFLPFEQNLMVSASLKRHNNKNIAYFFGAPEKLLENSRYFIKQGKTYPLTKDIREFLYNKLSYLTGQGERVLATAFKETRDTNLHKDHYASLLTNLVFVAFISLHDPIRSEVQNVLEATSNSGLKTVIVTGDYPQTAVKIAEKLNMGVSEHQIMDGAKLAAISDEELLKITQNIKIFSRVLPQDKLKIVQAFKRADNIVAMIGDGVNDAPAIKGADIGISVESASEVAKEAADLILIKNGFNVIVETIKQGRVIIDNIRKTVIYLLATNFTEIILVSSSLVLGLPIPILPIHIIWINFVEEGLQSFSLAFEPAEPDVFKRKPKKLKTLFTKDIIFLGFIIGILTDLILVGLFVFLLKNGLDFRHIMTIMFVGLSVDAIISVLAFRSIRRPLLQISPFSNPFLLIVLMINIFIVVLSVYWAPIQNILRLVPLNPIDWGFIAALAILELSVIELGKAIFIAENIYD